MGINRDKPDRWKEDIARSTDLFNDWFLSSAPQAFRETRLQTIDAVEKTLRITSNLTIVRPEVLRKKSGYVADPSDVYLPADCP